MGIFGALGWSTSGSRKAAAKTTTPGRCACGELLASVGLLRGCLPVCLVPAIPTLSCYQCYGQQHHIHGCFVSIADSGRSHLLCMLRLVCAKVSTLSKLKQHLHPWASSSSGYDMASPRATHSLQPCLSHRSIDEIQTYEDVAQRRPVHQVRSAMVDKIICHRGLQVSSCR